MTREEAIKMLKSKMDGNTDTSYEWAETVRMAIKALEQQPCEDAISRQATINAIGDVPDHDDGMVWEALSHAQRDVALLPPVQPKPKTETITEFADRCRECGKQKKGHWIKITPSGIYMCSECEQNVLTGDIDAYHYCHHCGVKMINESEKS